MAKRKQTHRPPWAGFPLEWPVGPTQGGRTRVWEDHTGKPPSRLSEGKPKTNNIFYSEF